MKKIRRYCVTDIVKSIVLSTSCFIVGTIIMLIIVLGDTPPEYYIGFFFTVCLYILAVGLFYNLYGYRNSFYKNNLKKYSGLYVESAVEADFDKSVKFMDDNIRAGKKFIYGKDEGGFAPYSAIDSLRIHRHDSLSSPHEAPDVMWYIEAQLAGRTVRLCKLKECPTDEWTRLGEYISAVAPDVVMEEKIKFSKMQHTNFERPPYYGPRIEL